MTDTTELDKAIDGLTAALTSDAPNWEPGMLLAVGRALLIVLLKLREEGA
jgi:hypothetical protein